MHESSEVKERVAVWKKLKEVPLNNSTEMGSAEREV